MFGRKKHDDLAKMPANSKTQYYDVWVTDSHGDVHKFCDVRQFYSGINTTGLTLHWYGDDQRAVYFPIWNVKMIETKLNREEITEVQYV